MINDGIRLKTSALVLLFAFAVAGCGGGGGSSGSSLSGPAPVVQFNATPTRVPSGGLTTLSWSATNATSCTASNGWTGSQSTTGSLQVGPVATTTTYDLSCTGSGGTTRKSLQIAVVAAPTVSISAAPPTVLTGGATTLTWSSTDTTACAAGGGWSGPLAVNGTQDVGPLRSTTIFAIACSGVGGNVQQTLIVNVNDPNSPTASLSANPSTIQSGSSVTLTWSSTNAATCTAGGGWSGTQPTSGSQPIGPLTATTTFSLVCTGIGGAGTQAVTVTVAPAPPTVTISAAPGNVSIGGSATVTWSSTNATACEASGGWLGGAATSGSAIVGPINATTIYTLTCTGDGGSSSNSATVTVPPPAAPTMTLLATPATLGRFTGGVLSWSSTDALSCAASGGWSGSMLPRGAAAIGPQTVTTSYSLTCTGPGGSITKTVSVDVSTASRPPDLSPVRIRDAGFVSDIGRPGHEGWTIMVDQPIIGVSSDFQLKLLGGVTNAAFDISDSYGVSLAPAQMHPNSNVDYLGYIWQGTISLPGRPFMVRARGTSDLGVPFTVVSRLFFPTDFGARWQSGAAYVVPGATYQVPLDLINTGAARTLHIVLSEPTNSLAMPAVPDQAVINGTTTISPSFVVPANYTGLSTLTIKATVTDVARPNGKGNSSSFSFSISSAN